MRRRGASTASMIQQSEECSNAHIIHGVVQYDQSNFAVICWGQGSSPVGTGYPSDKQYLPSISKEMALVKQMADGIAKSDSNVIIEGESGVGKNVVAEYIHRSSDRRKGPLVRINCGGISETLIESELFGSVRGAFTGAIQDRVGFFESANGGTIVLDEITDIPLSLQNKLLHVVEDKCLFRVGSVKRIDINARIVATTNRNTKSLVQAGVFRPDLYYRLAGNRVNIPPLRMRTDDIILLAGVFLKKYSGGSKTISTKALNELIHYEWPGNIRELDACIQATVSSCHQAIINSNDLVLDHSVDSSRTAVLRKTISCLLSENGGSIQRTADRLGLHRNTIYYYTKKYQIDVRGIRLSSLFSKH